MASRWSLILALVFSATAITACGGEGSRTPPLASGAVGSAGFADDSSPIEPGSALFPDHIIVIVMENHSLDDIVGATNVNGHHLFAPFLTQAAQTDRLATMAFGVAHPSLPNYLSMISATSSACTTTTAVVMHRATREAATALQVKIWWIRSRPRD